MNKVSSIFSRLTALLLLVVFALFVVIQDAHYFMAHDHHDEEQACTDRSTHHFHQSPAQAHCSVCFISSHTFPSPAKTDHSLPFEVENEVAPLFDQTSFSCHFFLPYALRAPPVPGYSFSV